jgi:DNA-directed RNA polymerase specialized sigma subunit
MKSQDQRPNQTVSDDEYRFIGYIAKHYAKETTAFTYDDLFQQGVLIWLENRHKCKDGSTADQRRAFLNRVVQSRLVRYISQYEPLMSMPLNATEARRECLENTVALHTVWNEIGAIQDEYDGVAETEEAILIDEFCESLLDNRKVLSERQAKVVKIRFGIEQPKECICSETFKNSDVLTQDREHTVACIAHEMGVPKDRARQLEARGIYRLRVFSYRQKFWSY